MSSYFTDEFGRKREDVFNEGNILKKFEKIVLQTSFHVYGVSGAWGTGKSVFISMWKEYMEETHKENCSVVYVNAFEKDYVEDPFVMLISAFNKYIKEVGISEEKTKNFLECAKEVLFSGVRALLVSATQFIKNNFTQTTMQSFFENFSFEKTKNDPCNELKEALKDVIKSSPNHKLYIVIDELDRCRPDFALETLERIKHLFSVDGVKFIIVYNPAIISSIVKSRYGCSEDDAANYINKFIEFDFQFSLKKSLFKSYIQYEASVLANENNISEEQRDFVQWHSESIADVLIRYRISSLREINKFIPSIKLINNSWGEKDYGFWLAISLLRFINVDEYDSLISMIKKNDGVIPQHSYSSFPTYFYLIMLYSPKNKSNEELMKMFETRYKNLPDLF